MIGIIGISHKTAPVKIRERLSFSKAEIENFIDSMTIVDKDEYFVFLSTCNRTEIIFSINSTCKSSRYSIITRKFVELFNLTDDLKTYFYSYYNEKAVKHLYSVASGIDAMMVGEDQIIGQLKEAYHISASRKLSGPILNKLFHTAFRVSKKVRNKTDISKGAVSISNSGVELANNVLGDLSSKNILLVGAGETSELVIKSIVKRGASNVSISNRTIEKAQNLAKLYNGKVVEYNNWKTVIYDFDLIIVSVTTPNSLLDSNDFKKVINKPLCIIDLSMPRSIDADICKIDNVFLYNIDDLKEIADKNSNKRKEEIERALEIIDSEVEDFYLWRKSLGLTPAIVKVQNCFDDIFENEFRIHSDKFSNQELEKIEDFGKHLTGKISKFFINRFKETSLEGQRLEVVDLVNKLFDIKGNEKD